MIMTAFIWPAAVIAITALVAVVALKAWRGWLELKRCELAVHRSGPEADAGPGVRIEMAAIKERLRKLEEIATGVDL
jgi:hypothetical protein